MELMRSCFTSTSNLGMHCSNTCNGQGSRVWRCWMPSD